VAIPHHLASDGPGDLGTFLREAGVAFDVFNTRAGQAFPEAIDACAALAALGGEMSANDARHSLRLTERSIPQAIARGVPVLGHCLGGQLMARALGEGVDASSAPEVGWHGIDLVPSGATRAWFGEAPSMKVFQWHVEAFGLPRAAQPLATNRNCVHPAFAVGPHLAMRFHIEVDQDMLALRSAEMQPVWLEAQRVWPSVHGGERMSREAGTALPAQLHAAGRVYWRWIALAGV
jgi:GMP synthase (glutamine-hydrolysing)